MMAVAYQCWRWRQYGLWSRGCGSATSSTIPAMTFSTASSPSRRRTAGPLLPGETATDDAIILALSHGQARIAHAALCAAAAIARANQIKMLDLHEAHETSAPITSQEAWQTFLAWQAKENDLSTVADVIRSSGVELHFNDFGLRPCA